MKIRIEVQMYAPRLEPAAPIRLADRNHAHYPSSHRTILKKDGSMKDFKNAQSEPHGSHRKMLLSTLDAPNPWCALTLFPLPKGNQSGCWDHQIHGNIYEKDGGLKKLKKELVSDG